MMDPLNSAFRTVTSLFRAPVKKIGLPPGTLVHVGRQKMERSIITYIDYSDSYYEVCPDVSLDDCRPLRDSDRVSWINLDGIHDIALIDAFGEAFSLHPLMLEDILNTGHPPKFEEFDDSALIIMKMLDFNAETCQLEVEQFSLVLTPPKCYYLSGA